MVVLPSDAVPFIDAIAFASTPPSDNEIDGFEEKADRFWGVFRGRLRGLFFERREEVDEFMDSKKHLIVDSPAVCVVAHENINAFVFDALCHFNSDTTLMIHQMRGLVREYFPWLDFESSAEVKDRTKIWDNITQPATNLVKAHQIRAATDRVFELMLPGPRPRPNLLRLACVHSSDPATILITVALMDDSDLHSAISHSHQGVIPYALVYCAMNHIEFDAYIVDYRSMSDDDIAICKARVTRIEQLIEAHSDDETAMFDEIWTLYHKSDALDTRIAHNSPHRPFSVGRGPYVSAPPMGPLFHSREGGAAAGFVDACR